MARASSERDAVKASGKAEESDGRTGSSVERSLEEFIARANAVTPPDPPASPTVLHDPSASGKRRRKETELGPDDRTEIVARPLPYTPPSHRRFVWTMVAVAFAAGGAAVVLALRLLSPRPLPAAPPVAPIPPVVVIPQPTVEHLPEPMADFRLEVKPVAGEAKTVEPAKPEPPPPRKKKKPDKDGKAPTGLVDPFAE